MRVLLADDDEFVRRGLRAILASQRNCEVIAEAVSGDEAVRLAILHRPDVAVLDIRLPVLNGFAAASRIVEKSPHTAVLMLSLSHDAQHIARVLAAGVHGYVVKDEVAEHLPQAVFAVRARRHYLSPSATDAVRAFADSGSFSAFEREVLTLFDRYAARLLWCATASNTEEHAATTLPPSFLAYLLARIAGQYIPNAPAWLFASAAAFSFDRFPIAAGVPDAHRTMVSAIRSWCRERLRPHPAISELVSHWSSGMLHTSHRHLLEHVRRCAVCHFECCLVAAAHAPVQPAESASDDLLFELRQDLKIELRKYDLGLLAASLREHNRRLNVLLASELDMLFGAAAASHWFSTPGPRRLLVSPLIEQFLGAHTLSLATTLRIAPSSLW